MISNTVTENHWVNSKFETGILDHRQQHIRSLPPFKHIARASACVIAADTFLLTLQIHNDVIMSAMASQITSLTIVYSTVYWGSASLAFVRGIHWWPVNSPHEWPVTRKMFPFDDVIMHQLLVDTRYVLPIKAGITGLFVGISPFTREFPAQRAINVENVSIWWRHH